MRPRPRRYSRLGAVGAAAASLSVALALASTLGASAHDLGRLVVEPPIVDPGGAISVHGSALWTEAPVTVTLVDASGTRRTVASSVTSAAGDLEVVTRMPDDVASGACQVIVATESGEHVEGRVVVRSPVPVAALVGGALVVAAAAIVVIIALAMVRRRRRSDAVTDEVQSES